MRYFEFPEQAVAEISKLLAAEDWATLAEYYDLTGTSIDRKDLESGRFFVNSKPPAISHPAGFWRYRHPFPPSFRYDSHEISGDIATVRVSIQIDQGDGMIQRSSQTFRMKKSGQGWQILPG